MTIDRAVLQRRWVHAHEEDAAGEMVFRPDDVQLPPSRGRLAFELRSDGSYAESAIGPTDRPQDVAGTWELDDDELVLSRNASDEPERRLHVVSATPDRLVVVPSV